MNAPISSLARAATRSLYALVFLTACTDAAPSKVDADADLGDAGDTRPGDTDTGDTHSADTDAEPDSSPEDATLDGELPPFELEPLTWTSCGDGFLDQAAFECAIARVPLDWAKPESGLIDLPVARTSSSGEPIVRQIWYLTGGPGGTLRDSYLRQQMRELTTGASVPTMVIAPAFRGVQGEDALRCNEAETEDFATFLPDDIAELLPSCIDSLSSHFGEGLGHFSTTQAAHDVAALERLLAEPGARQFLYGASYGTARAQRVLSVAPDVFDGVVLDSAVPVTGSWVTMQTNVDGTAEYVFTRCAEQAECASRFDDDPWLEALDTMAMLRAGHCPTSEGFTFRDYQYLFALAHERSFAQLPSLVSRVRRCGRDDRDAIVTAAAKLGVRASLAAEPEFMNLALHTLVVARDFKSDGTASPDDVQEAMDASFMHFNNAVTYRLAEDLWPAFAPDPYAGQYPTTAVPMAIIHCMLDGSIDLPDLEPMMEHYTAPNQRLHLIPNGAHVCGRANFSCARQITTAFLADPQSNASVSTIEGCRDPVDLDFGGAFVTELYGTASAWD